MTDVLSIECGWTDPIGSPEEIAQTAALIDIRLGDRHITRAENDFSKTVTDRVPLSAYPLVLWFAESWWRLRWECSPAHTPPLDWRMSHELAAAGAGFVWPPVVLESDGESIRLSMRPAPPSQVEPLRYLEYRQGWTSGDDFERSVGGFIDLACARLTDRGLSNTQLHLVWAEVLSERADIGRSRFRQIEAMLGFDPGGTPDALVNRFLELSNRAGMNASNEIAHAAAGERPEQVLDAIIKSAGDVGALGRFQLPQRPTNGFLGHATPWERGYKMAREIRAECALGQVLEDRALAELLGLQQGVLVGDGMPSTAPAGIAIPGTQGVRFIFRRPRRLARRFEAARLLSDYLLAPDSDTWFLETDAHTSRQKSQRAFAAELLCPIEALQEYLQGELSDSKVENAAEHFQVSDYIVRRQLVNNQVPGYGSISL